MAAINPAKCNSDFTRFHSFACRTDITLTDLDAVQFRIMEDGTERIRFIEYKHKNESRRKMQNEVLKRFMNFIPYLNKISRFTLFELYMVVCNFKINGPEIYLEDQAKVYNLIEKNSKELNELELISFLDFTTNWEDL
tara:strand:+ start:1676 stop:2089 length:414 start_codon:yes stop_codon:yes gene_type:complete